MLSKNNTSKQSHLCDINIIFALCYQRKTGSVTIKMSFTNYLKFSKKSSNVKEFYIFAATNN